VYSPWTGIPFYDQEIAPLLVSSGDANGAILLLFNIQPSFPSPFSATPEDHTAFHECDEDSAFFLFSRVPFLSPGEERPSSFTPLT